MAIAEGGRQVGGLEVCAILPVVVVPQVINRMACMTAHLNSFPTAVFLG